MKGGGFAIEKVLFLSYSLQAADHFLLTGCYNFLKSVCLKIIDSEGRRIDLKKNLFRVISFVLCFILVTPMSAFARQSADDYSGHWAGNQIKSFMEKGFIAVDQNGNFKPDDPITRADFAVMANKAFGFTEKPEAGFKDVIPRDSYYNDLLIAKKAGYYVGQPDGTVLPGSYMTRQECALIILRLLKMDTITDLEAANSFADAAVMPQWSKGAVGAVAKAGYMQGEPGNVFNPKGVITRGQAVAVLERCYNDKVAIAYNKPGTYSANVVEGNVAINVRDVNLEDTTITGNLIIGEGVGDGNVKLKNVTVKGDTIVKGGGLNSIIIEDSQIRNIIIIKEDNKVRIVAVGATTIEQVDMQSGGKLEEQDVTGAGFGYVTISESTDPNEPIILMGNFDSIQIQAEGVNLNIASGTVANLNIAQTASNAQIVLGNGTSVTNVVVNSPAVVTGNGTIGTAQVNVQNTTITVPTTTTNTAAGVTVSTTLPSPTQTPAPTAAPTPAPTPVPTPPSSGGSGSGGGSGRDDDDDKYIYVNAITVTGTGNASAITTDDGTLQMLAAVTPANATNKAVTWSVTNGTGAATISNTGVLRAVSDGTVTVKATARDGSGKFGTKEITISNQVPVVLYTSSIIASGAVDPSVTVAVVNDTFTANGISNLPANWTISAGVTGLTVGTITRKSDTEMTFRLTGKAQAGALTLKAKAPVLAGGAESNTITIFALGGAPAEAGTIGPAEGVNGIADIEPTIDGYNITFGGKIAYYTANGKNGLPVSGNWIGVRVTAPEGIAPDDNAFLYVNGRSYNYDGKPGWGNIKEEGDGDNYFHLYQRITDISRVYSIVIKWNNELTEAYTIDFAPGSSLVEYDNYGTIEPVEGFNGGENATVVVEGQTIIFDGELEYRTDDVPAPGSWIGVKITAPEGVLPDENAVLTVHGEVLNVNGEPGWDNIREEGDGDDFFHLYMRVKHTAYVYEAEIKWNNALTETYLIVIQRGATLEFSKAELTKLKDMLDAAKARYDNAERYGDTGIHEINYLGEVIDDVQDIYDNAKVNQNGTVMTDIYYAQDILAEAIEEFDAFETEIVLTASPNLDEIVADAVYYGDSNPVVITLEVYGIGEFASGLGDYMILGGTLSDMKIKSVTIEEEEPNIAELKLTGTIGAVEGGGNIIIKKGGVYGHDHGFSARYGTIDRAPTINGGDGIEVEIDEQWIRFFDGEIDYYTAAENGVPEDGNYVGVKITAPAGVIPDENAVLTAYGEEVAAGWSNIGGKRDSNGNYYFHLHQKVTHTAFVYEVEIKWNDDVTEKYFIHIRGTAELKPAD